MNLKESKEIKILVNKEEDLYTPFSPDSELNDDVKNYIKSKIIPAGYQNNFTLTVIYSDAIDEDRFRAAVSNWIKDEKEIFRQKAEASRRLLIGLFVIASIFIIANLAMVKTFNVLSYTIIPVMGTVALWKAADICITELPIINVKRKLLREMENNNNIVFKKFGSE